MDLSRAGPVPCWTPNVAEQKKTLPRSIWEKWELMGRDWGSKVMPNMASVCTYHAKYCVYSSTT